MYLSVSTHRQDAKKYWPRIKISLFIFLVCYAHYLQAARLPSAKRECAVCHVMWLTEFKRTDVETLIPYNPTPDEGKGKTNIVSTRRMCFSCHDGFIQDSRFMWKKGSHTHPVGVKPSDKVKIPLIEGKEFFPLNDDGNLYCGTCHTAHGVDWENTGTAVFMRMKNEKGQLCLACHEKKGGGTKNGGHPVFDKKLKDPPQSLIKAGVRLDSDGNLLCQSCHRPHGAAGKKMLVLPNDRSQFCGACHSDKYASDKETASEKGTHPINVSSDKVHIPEELKKSGAKVGKNGKIICQSCHSPHYAVPETPILVKSNNQSALCETCHEDQAIVADGKHDMRLVDAASQNIRKQSVKEGGVCSACHLAHKGNGPKMWARPLNNKQEPMAALCESCHRNKGLASKARVGAYSHPVGVRFNHTDSIGLPTFDKAGIRQTNGNKGMVTCASCHDPHRWDPKNPKADAAPGSSSDSTNRFLRKANSYDSGLCRTCHRQQANVSNSKHNLELTAPKERNIHKQTTSQSGVCGGCHLVHNAAGPLLWARTWPTGKDQLTILCMSCHESEGIAGKKGVGQHSHPVNIESSKLPVNISEGRWTDQTDRKPLQSLPLYNNRGKRVQTNGLLGCSTCHNPHVWSPVGKAVNSADVKKTEGGSNDSFLRIADKGESALCINCHTDKQAISKSKHNLAMLGIKDPQNETEGHDSKSGICSSCHSPHNAKGSKLWIRKKGPGKGAIETLCTDCHQEGGTAEKKLVGNYNHPIGIKMPTSMKAGDLPVYSKDGKRIDQNNGVIDCSTCHDPHRWTADNTKKSEMTSDLKTEGDARNSFLRLTAAPSSQLCVTCHQDKQSIIATDHDLRITGPTAKNRHGQNVDESGVCGQCHTPHRGYDSSLLWARYFDDENVTNKAEQRCRSCHHEGEIAEHKIPKAAKHPVNVNMLSGKVRKALFNRPIPVLPVYDSNGKQADVGTITCSSCHNPHQWDPARDEKGPGKNTEGDVSTSFLRIDKTASFVCADCHGTDSIFRYKYFHSKSTHKQEN